MSDANRPHRGSASKAIQLRSRRLVIAAIALSCASLGQSCSFVHYDEDSNTTHVWGFGHLAIRATPASEDVRGIVSSVENAGFTMGSWRSSQFVSVGWSRQQAVEVIDDDTQFRIDAPRTNLLSIDVGTKLLPGEHERP